MTAKKKHPGGRPTKWSKALMPKLEKLYRLGLTDSEVADIIDVTEQTINNWKIKQPKFFESLRDWKLTADKEVELSLRQRACGWTDSEGKEYPPDATSMIFWLKNRNPKEWRDKIDAEVTGKDGGPFVVKIEGSDTDVL